MSFIELIKEYQTLVGSFLAIVSSLALWSLKEIYDKKKLLKKNKKEIENIFFMMARDTEESVKDLIHYIPLVRKRMLEKKEGFHVFRHSSFNKVYVNEDRLFMLKHGLGFILSQQIDIAIASAKKFNSFLESFETEPNFIFDSTVKTIQSGIESKERAVTEYKKSIGAYLNKIERMLGGDLRHSQINILRPVAALFPKYDEIINSKVSTGDIDKMLHADAEFLLIAIKQDLT